MGAMATWLTKAPPLRSAARAIDSNSASFLLVLVIRRPPTVADQSNNLQPQDFHTRQSALDGQASVRPELAAELISRAPQLRAAQPESEP
jgi:hypothetical protein